MILEKIFAANYPGDRRNVDKTKPVGPNSFGEYFLPSEVTFDEAANKSRIVFELIPANPEPVDVA